jgi:hypothetical protein
VEHHEVVLLRERDDPLEESAIDHRRGRIVRERDDQHLRLRPRARDRDLEVRDQVRVGRERHVAQVAARDDHRVLVDRIGGIGTQHDVAGPIVISTKWERPSFAPITAIASLSGSISTRGCAIPLAHAARRFGMPRDAE